MDILDIPMLFFNLSILISYIDRRSTRERGHFSGRVSLGNRGRGRQEEPSQNEQLNKHNYPGRDVLTKVQADNMRKYSPLATKYSTLENSDIAQESEFSFQNNTKFSIFEVIFSTLLITTTY